MTPEPTRAGSKAPHDTQHWRLSDWLAWHEVVHGQEIELGLERCRCVAGRMGVLRPPYLVISVAGTNGKGSCVAMLSSVLRAAGYRVGTYTSPHLRNYNERIQVDENTISDTELCAAFEHVERARDDISLTYFEFGTLAALDLFQNARLDIGILEVGLGGRLDAVNIIDADVALLTTISIDHVEWLGPDREAIAREKAGILRSGRPAVCVDPDPPESLLDAAQSLGARLLVSQHDFLFELGEQSWSWICNHSKWTNLARPNLIGDYQVENAAAVLTVLQLISVRYPVDISSVNQGLKSVSLHGRFDVIDGPIEYVLDVAHNPQAATKLAQNLRALGRSRVTHAVIGMLKDKDLVEVLAPLNALAQRWYLGELASGRSASVGQLVDALNLLPDHHPALVFDSVTDAFRAAIAAARPGDRVVVFGSFLSVGAAMDVLEEIDNEVAVSG